MPSTKSKSAKFLVTVGGGVEDGIVGLNDEVGIVGLEDVDVGRGADVVGVVVVEVGRGADVVGVVVVEVGLDADTLVVDVKGLANDEDIEGFEIVEVAKIGFVDVLEVNMGFELVKVGLMDEPYEVLEGVGAVLTTTLGELGETTAVGTITLLSPAVTGVPPPPIEPPPPPPPPPPLSSAPSSAPSSTDFAGVSLGLLKNKK